MTDTNWIELTSVGHDNIQHRRMMNIATIFEAVYTANNKHGEAELSVQIAADLPALTYKGDDATRIWKRIEIAGREV